MKREYKLLLGAVAISFCAGLAVYLFSGYNKTVSSNGEIKVIIAAYKGDTALLPYIAESNGYFNEEGLTVEFKNFTSGKEAADELIAGGADIATVTESVFVSNLPYHKDMRILCSIADANTIGIISRTDKKIRRIKDLKGKRIGVTLKSSGEYSLNLILASAGLSLADITTVNLKPEEIVNSLFSGKIDAGCTWEPNLYNAIAGGGEKFKILKYDVTGFNFLLISRDRWLRENSGKAEKVIRALIKAEHYVLYNNIPAAEFMKNYFGYSDEYVVTSWNNHRFIVELPQALLIRLEAQLLWIDEEVLAQKNFMPDLTDYIYYDALNSVEPGSVKIIKVKP